MNGLVLICVSSNPVPIFFSVRELSMPAWVMRLALPLLFGLAAAFVLTGAWKLREQTHAIHLSPGQVFTPDVAMASWAEVILEKNILELEIPGQGEVPQGRQEENDPASWAFLGTLTGKTPKAVLREDDQLLILHQGAVFNGWELAEVLPRSVVWVAEGKRREVHMWTKAPAVGPVAPAHATPSQPWPPASGTRVSLSRQEVQPLLSDPNAMLQMANFKPFFMDGKVSGFQVLSIRPESLLYKVGLRSGDVLARINGQTLTGPAQLLQAYSGMDRASLVTLDIQRASQMLTYLVEIN